MATTAWSDLSKEPAFQNPGDWSTLTSSADAATQAWQDYDVSNAETTPKHTGFWGKLFGQKDKFGPAAPAGVRPPDPSQYKPEDFQAGGRYQQDLVAWNQSNQTNQRLASEGFDPKNFPRVDPNLVQATSREYATLQENIGKASGEIKGYENAFQGKADQMATERGTYTNTMFGGQSLGGSNCRRGRFQGLRLGSSG